MLARIAQEAALVLDGFDEPPAFDLWRNPVTESAGTYETLRTVARDSGTDDLFRCSGAPALVDDGKDLIDGGITPHRRLWLLYRYHSLTDLDGYDRYTIGASVVSVIRCGPHNVDLSIGFDWLRNAPISRLSFEVDEEHVQAKVLSVDNWRALHQVKVRT